MPAVLLIMHHSGPDFDPRYQADSTESRIVASLERIAQAFRVLLWQESLAYGLSPIQVQVLIFLRFHDTEKARVSYLADEFNMSRATMSEAVKSLEGKQLVKRMPDQKDARSHLLQLTARGRKVADKTAQFSEAIRLPVQQLSPAAKEQMMVDLLDIIRQLTESGVITLQRMCFTCAHYRRRGGQHFCGLLNQPLGARDLRLDCPEHEAAETAA